LALTRLTHTTTATERWDLPHTLTRSPAHPLPSLPTHTALAVQRVNVIIDVSIDADKELNQEKLQRGRVGVAKVNTEVARSVNGERVPT
jgi:hypothetical protein